MTSSQHFLELDYEEEFPPLKNDGSQYSSNELASRSVRKRTTSMGCEQLHGHWVSLEDTLAVPKYVREPMVETRNTCTMDKYW